MLSQIVVIKTTQNDKIVVIFSYLSKITKPINNF